MEFETIPSIKDRQGETYLVSLGDRVLDTCCGLHAVRNGFIHSRGGSRGQDSMLKRFRVASEAPLLGRKNCFLILQSPLHYELILGRAKRPGDEEHTEPRFTPTIGLFDFIQ